MEEPVPPTIVFNSSYNFLNSDCIWLDAVEQWLHLTVCRQLFTQLIWFLSKGLSARWCQHGHPQLKNWPVQQELSKIQAACCLQKYLLIAADWWHQLSLGKFTWQELKDGLLKGRLIGRINSASLEKIMRGRLSGADQKDFFYQLKITLLIYCSVVH